MTDLSREYGEGLFLLCQEEGLPRRVEDDLTAICQLLRDEPDYARLLGSHAVPRKERLQLVDEALRGRVADYTLNFVKILIERGALHELPGCLEHFHARALDESGVVEAKVVAAKPLTPAQTEALTARLSQLSGKKAQLVVSIDPAVVGGLRVDMQGKRYDNTIQHRMDLMRRRLTDEM